MTKQPHIKWWDSLPENERAVLKDAYSIGLMASDEDICRIWDWENPSEEGNSTQEGKNWDDIYHEWENLPRPRYELIVYLKMNYQYPQPK